MNVVTGVKFMACRLGILVAALGLGGCGPDRPSSSSSSQRGRPLPVAYAASSCGETARYAELQQLHRSYQARGVLVLGAPFPKRATAAGATGLFEQRPSPLHQTLSPQPRWNSTWFMVDKGVAVARLDALRAP
ncbi:MAG: hypothetical protein Q8O67_27940 [Deltaproteobacteria bacterium]|nr:hypothetical protein [Deltaproteobacteria bacterium]